MSIHTAVSKVNSMYPYCCMNFMRSIQAVLVQPTQLRVQSHCRGQHREQVLLLPYMSALQQLNLELSGVVAASAIAVWPRSVPCTSAAYCCHYSDAAIKHSCSYKMMGLSSDTACMLPAVYDVHTDTHVH
jgi:hypothetical protein